MIQEEINRLIERLYSQYGLNSPFIKHDPVFKQCIQDAIEYFEPMGILLNSPLNRIILTREQKQSVFNFLKDRKEYYGINGLVI